MFSTEDLSFLHLEAYLVCLSAYGPGFDAAALWVRNDATNQ
jgi:hypothetical protein